MRRVLGLATVIGLALGLEACGGGGEPPVVALPEPVLQQEPMAKAETDEETPATVDEADLIPSGTLFPVRASDVDQLPVNYRDFDGGRLHVGQNIAPGYPLTEYQWEGSVRLFHGGRHEHVDSGQLAEYLEEVSGDELRTFLSPPTVRIGQALEYRENVYRAVQWINEALPPDKHIKIGTDVPTLSSSVPDGAIYIDFGSISELGDNLPAGAAGTAHLNDSGSNRIAAHVYISPDRVGWYDESDDIIMDKVIVHELLHGLGFGGHTDRQNSRLFSVTLGRYDPTTMLFPIDREALFLSYEGLAIGSDWSTLADHFVLQKDHAEAGVSRQSIAAGGTAFLQGWASGDVPPADLSDSALTGTVTWLGSLIGVRPEYTATMGGDAYSTVTGSVEITVGIAHLSGSAVFDELEAHQAIVPGPVGEGVEWGDGVLSYNIAVRGNTFHQTGGDEGLLTGIFTGHEHEGAAGVLERTDLMAAFVADR